MDAEIYLHRRLLLTDGANGIVDLLVAAVIRVPLVGRAGIHLGESKRGSKLGGNEVR
jgi:hypothetical protein